MGSNPTPSATFRPMGAATPPTKTIYLNGIIVGEVLATGDRDNDMEAMRQFLKDKGLHREVTKVQAMFRHGAVLLNDRCSPASNGLAQGTAQRVEHRAIRRQLRFRH